MKSNRSVVLLGVIFIALLLISNTFTLAEPTNEIQKGQATNGEIHGSEQLDDILTESNQKGIYYIAQNGRSGRRGGRGGGRGGNNNNNNNNNGGPGGNNNNNNNNNGGRGGNNNNNNNNNNGGRGGNNNNNNNNNNFRGRHSGRRGGAFVQGQP